MFPLFESSASMLAVILCMIALAFWLQKFKGFKTLGPALIVIILGIILVNLKIVPGYCDVYGAISIYCIPISMSLYLLNVDLKKILQMSKQPLLSIASAVFSVSLVAILLAIATSIVAVCVREVLLLTFHEEADVSIPVCWPGHLPCRSKRCGRILWHRRTGTRFWISVLWRIFPEKLWDTRYLFLPNGFLIWIWISSV